MRKRKVRPYVERKVKDKTETRDAILWSIERGTGSYLTDHIAWVKIQGSDELIAAHFPQNQKSFPSWARPGNAVIIRHRSGMRGYVEVIGEGRAVPKPAIGVVHPEPLDLVDHIIEGLEILPTTPPSMSVYITSGSYIIDGVVYYYLAEALDLIVMDDPPPMVMEADSPHVMGAGNYTLAIDPPCSTSGEWRYDLVQIGKDIVLDYLTGECSTNPTFPEVEEDHLQVGKYIYVSWNTTVIESWNIGYIQQAQIPSWLDLTVEAISPAEYDDLRNIFYWCDPVTCGSYPNPEVYIHVTIQDQVGYDCLPGPAGFDLSLTKLSGTGQVYSADDGWNSSSVSQNIDGSSYSFKYRRIEDSTEYYPQFIVELDALPPVERRKTMYLIVSGETLAGPET